LARRGAAPDAAGDGQAEGPPQVQPRTGSGEVSSREDVIRLLDKACEYFKRNEPSSPVPLLLQRAKRLVSKDFLGIVQDLAPGGVAEVRSIGGLDPGGE
jgi:type VI secretion system protein ImpA